MDSKKLIVKLINRKDLTSSEAQFLLSQMAEGQCNASQIAAIVTALHTKGEAVTEIAGFIKGMREHMLRVKTTGLVIDTCGTGGDSLGTFNISTTVAFVVAAAGVKVAKHGNRAASSKCGSADVLEALGVRIMLTPQQAEKVLEKVGIVFLFAPLFHPSMKQVAQVRRELGFPTIFNFLGPFTNPAGVTRQIIGVSNREMAKKLAQVAVKLGYKHVLIIHGKDNLDEISIHGETEIFEIKGTQVKSFRIQPKDFDITISSLKAIQGGNAKQNAETIIAILEGKEKGAKRNIVLLNSACAFYVAGKVKTIQEGLMLAKKTIDTGAAKQILDNLVKETQKYA